MDFSLSDSGDDLKWGSGGSLNGPKMRPSLSSFVNLSRTMSGCNWAVMEFVDDNGICGPWKSSLKPCEKPSKMNCLCGYPCR